LCIIELKEDMPGLGCPLCQEDKDRILHFVAQSSALMIVWKSILGDDILSLDTLSDIHWCLLFF